MERLDKFLLAKHPDMTRSRIEGLIKSGFVMVNGVIADKAGTKVSENDAVEMEIPPPIPAIPEPEDIPLSVIYEDEDIIVVDKQPGLVVHPAPGHGTGTLVNALLHHIPNLGDVGGRERPGIVHRLDQETSGLIIVAKTTAAMTGLAHAFSSHANVEKTYLAICHGRPRLDAGHIECLIGSHPVDRKRRAIVERNGKLAITDWRLVNAASLGLADAAATPRPNDAKSPISLIECRIATGRTHQIRIHMASLGCPVIGDKMYGKPARDKQLVPVPERQMLHAWRLSLWHPVRSVKMSFEAPIPPDMRQYL